MQSTAKRLKSKYTKEGIASAINNIFLYCTSVTFWDIYRMKINDTIIIESNAGLTRFVMLRRNKRFRIARSVDFDYGVSSKSLVRILLNNGYRVKHLLK